MLMAVPGKQHRELLNGVGKCSVPMWGSGCPDGFCDKPAFGEPTQCHRYTRADGTTYRADGKYDGYVPGLACPSHGGPNEPNHMMDCNTCGEPFDMREVDQVMDHEVCTPTTQTGER